VPGESRNLKAERGKEKKKGARRTARIEGGKDKEDRFKLITGRRGK
jgi:hypothetical protein